MRGFGVVSMEKVIGVDIGGTKIATVIVNQEGEIISRSEVSSDASDKERMFNQVKKSIDAVLQESGIPIEEISGMGVGVPGKVDRENGVAVFQNNLPWRNFPIVSRLQASYPIEKIVLDNDVYMATFAEWNYASANVDETFVYMTISTGISCAIIQEGSFLRGNGFAGEVGLLPVLNHRSSGKAVTLEQAASGVALEKKAQSVFNDPRMTTAKLFAAYYEEDQQAVEIIHEMVSTICYGLYPIVCVLDPHKIVLGGGVINHNPILIDLIKKQLEEYMIPEQRAILNNIFASEYKGNSGVVGAGLKASNK